jgi:DNA-binding MarR family transcriptional regulator
MKNEIHSPAGLLLTQLILETFRLNGRLLIVGDQLTKDLGLTSARWQIFGAIVQAQTPLTVPSIARNMGLQRQSVQRIIDVLHKESLVKFEENPHHQKAKLVTLTSAGHTVFKKVSAIQITWSNEIAEGLDLKDLDRVITMMRTIRERLDDA